MHFPNYLIAFLSSIILFSCGNSKIRSNSQAEIQILPDSIYSRAITSNGNTLYLGSSNGLIYSYRLRNGKTKQLTKISIPEIRDIHLTQKGILAMQSNDTSKLFFHTSMKDQIIEIDSKPRFWDGMDILPSGIGLLMGDPIDGYFSLFKTTDFGLHWIEIEPKIPAFNGEAGFAASGSTVRCLNDSTFCFVSGGMKSRFFNTTNAGKTWTIVEIDYAANSGSGAFSMCFINALEGVIVGGDYTLSNVSENTSFFTSDGGKTWQKSENPTLGYRSHVISYKDTLYACGTTGMDVSYDKGKTWKFYLEGNFIAMHLIKNRLFVTLPKGKIKTIALPY